MFVLRELLIRENPIGIDDHATREKIACLIKESGKSNKEIGDSIYQTEQAVSKWRNCKGTPNLENVFLLSHVLNIKMEDMIVPKTETTIDQDIRLYSEEYQLSRLKKYFEKIKSMNWKKRSITKTLDDFNGFSNQQLENEERSKNKNKEVEL